MTYAILPVDPATYEDVKARLLKAGYGHCIMPSGELNLGVRGSELALERRGDDRREADIGPNARVGDKRNKERRGAESER